MDHRTAFVTGASSGMGRDLALRLARRGVEVALAARRVQSLEEAAEEIRAEGGRARVVPLDVTDVGATLAAVREADDAMGGLDLVVAAAGVSSLRWSGALRRGDWEPVIAVNVTGAVATLTAVIDRMVERRRGHLVGISSLARYRAMPKFATYAGTKAFLSTFLEGLRVDLLHSGITVTDVRPGFVRTPMLGGQKTLPFEVPLTDAAAIIDRAIHSGRAVVEFPFPLAALVRSTMAVPPGLYARALARKR